MSYILEALKKAQAERQLGATPTIHAPTLAAVSARDASSVVRKPLKVAIAVMGLSIVALLLILLRQQTQASVAAAPDAPPMAAPAPVPVPVPAVAAPVVPTEPIPAPVIPPAPAPAIAAAPAPQPAVEAKPVPAPVPAKPAAVVAPKPIDPPPAKEVASAPAPARPAEAQVQPEEQVQSKADLPEPIQRAIPPVAMSGYMYSKNPADRLILIDKALRHEGDEVAPGLVLERLQSKAAIFSFRGYRYRVPY